VGSTTLQPGEQTTVSLSMIMHTGMEGPHLFRVTVPVASEAGQELEMYVAADFQ
jgi:hypothetical protein